MALSTPYELYNQHFSDKGHLLARKEIYPLLFRRPQSELEFSIAGLSEEEAKRRDYEDGIDRTVEVAVKGLIASSMPFTIQERIRRPSVAYSPDITITEWNHNSDSPSELYKIKADFFNYAKYDEYRNRFTEAIVFDVTRTRLAITQGYLQFERRKNKKNQSFITILISDLERLNLVYLHPFWRQ